MSIVFLSCNDYNDSKPSFTAAVSTKSLPSTSMLISLSIMVTPVSVRKSLRLPTISQLDLTLRHISSSSTARLPVIYVFTKQPIDVDHAALTLSDSAHTTLLTDQQQLPAALVLTYSVAWEHAARSVYNKLKEILGEKRVTIPLLLTEVDTRRNYEGKLANRNPSPVQQSPVRGQAATCCSSSSSPCQPTSTCDTSSSCCKTSSSSQQLAQAPPADSQPSVEQQRQDAPLGPGRSLQLPEGVKLTDCAFLHIGPESLSLTNLILTLGPTTPIISYDPFTQRSRVETGATNRLLMKRYTHVLKARDASVIGLLVGTLGVHSYLPLLKHLRALLTSRKSARKVYTISVGKLNPAKLANFQEIDLFVLIACPENSLVDSKEFFRPIVTPFEMELALRAQERAERGEEGVDWTGEYQLDLDRLVPADVRDKFAHEESQSQADGADGGQEDEGDDDDQPHFSLITGKYVHRRKYTRNPTETTGSKAVEGGKEQQLVATGTPGVESHTVALRQADGTMTTVLQSASTAHLEHRGWRGLEQRIGLDEPSVLEEGREGIAKGYRSAEGTHEGTQP